MGALVLSYGEDEEGHQTAMEYATEIINSRDDILKDYELVLGYANTFVSLASSYSGRDHVLQRWGKANPWLKYNALQSVSVQR